MSFVINMIYLNGYNVIMYILIIIIITYRILINYVNYVLLHYFYLFNIQF